MVTAISATYDGAGKFVLDRKLELETGQKVKLTVITSNKKKLIRENLNLNQYMGKGAKMFGSAEEVDNYIRDMRDNDRF